MTEFDERKYLDEMQNLLHEAKRKWLAEYSDVQVYTISVWTDPDAAASAVSFDTFESSERKMVALNKWAEKTRKDYLEKGDLEMAALLVPKSGRNANPADFAYANFAETEHCSFASLWEEQSHGACWDALDPALQAVARTALKELSDLSRHPEAELGVNSRQDWYHYTWRFE